MSGQRKRLYNGKTERLNHDGELLAKTASVVIGDVIRVYAKQGYSMRDVMMIVQGEVQDQCYAHILGITDTGDDTK